MEWYSWVFEGIGTSIISAFFGLVLGGIGGFVIGRKTKSKQIQKAKNNAKQWQAVDVDNTKNGSLKKPTKTETAVVQKQKAKNNANQVQIGSVKNGRG